MFSIAISNHPTFSDIHRTVSMYDLKFDEIKKRIIVDLKINHKINEIPIEDLTRTISLSLDNSAQFPDGEGNLIGDYDYFYSMAELGAPLKTLIEAGISLRDSDGSINAKCEYK